MFTIDLGTSGPKVALFTLTGEYVDGEFSPVDLEILQGGGVEQRPQDWWSGIVEASRRMWQRCDEIERSQVIAVSVTSQWSGTVPVDANHEAVHNAIIWMDSRGSAQTRDLVRGRINVEGYDPLKLKKWIQLTGGIPSHSGKDTLCHMLFVEQALPEVAKKTAMYLEPKDYLNARLTGRAVSTYDTMVLTWLTDNRVWDRIDYVPELLSMAGIDRSKLPDMIAATDIVGDVLESVATELGIPAGIPVIGGTPDVQSATIGSGAVRDYEAHLYIGTSSWLTCHVPKKKTDVFAGVAALPSPLPGKYFVADEQETAGATLNWLRDNVLYPTDALGGAGAPEDAFARIDALAAASPAGSNGVIFTPWLNGERTPVDDHTVRAGWFNLSLGTTRADQVRAVLEGVAFNSRWMLGVVEKFCGREFPWLNIIGGGGRSDLWCQIFADVMNRPIRQVENPIRANARGAALLAGIALGRITVDEIAEQTAVTATFTPNPEHRAMYDSMYDAFSSIYKSNKGMYRRLNHHL